MIAGLFFYMFALVLIVAAALVVTVRQPVTAVLLLILCFFNAAGLFLLMGAEFLAFIMLIVYVGAVAVLFLFVVMMLDMRRQSTMPRGVAKRWLPASLAVGGAIFVEMAIAVWSLPAAKLAQAATQPEQMENTRLLGRVLYTDFAYPFQVSGLILLVAMIGAITLTHRKSRTKKTQNVLDQLDRGRDDVIEIRKVKSGEGASL